MRFKQAACAAIIFTLCLSAILTVTDTLAKYTYTFFGTDSAKAAEFDIEITEPSELDTNSTDNPFKHHFSEKEEIKLLGFSVTNNREVAVRCAPSIDGGVSYEIAVSGEVCESFNVGIGETVDFQVIIMTDGLKINPIQAKLVLDIQQL